ncbi:unnamed protein product [Urochloa humidicola]
MSARRRGRAAAPATRPARSTAVSGCCLPRSPVCLAGLSKNPTVAELMQDAADASTSSMAPAPRLRFVPIRTVPQLAAAAAFFDAVKAPPRPTTTTATAATSSPPLTITTTPRTRSADRCPRRGHDSGSATPDPAVDPARQRRRVHHPPEPVPLEQQAKGSSSTVLPLFPVATKIGEASGTIQLGLHPFVFFISGRAHQLFDNWSNLSLSRDYDGSLGT